MVREGRHVYNTPLWEEKNPEVGSTGTLTSVPKKQKKQKKKHDTPITQRPSRRRRRRPCANASAMKCWRFTRTMELSSSSGGTLVPLPCPVHRRTSNADFAGVAPSRNQPPTAPTAYRVVEPTEPPPPTSRAVHPTTGTGRRLRQSHSRKKLTTNGTKRLD